MRAILVIVALIVIAGIGTTVYNMGKKSVQVPVCPTCQTPVAASCPPPTPPAPCPVCPTCQAPIPASIAAGTVVNGKVYRCGTTGAIYIIENNTKRWYPNPTIYAKYGNPAVDNTFSDCTPLYQVPGGPDMQ